MGAPLRPLDRLSQPIQQTVSATAASDGTATFTFPSPPVGLTWTGTVSIKQAPVGSTFTAVVGATDWGTWGGNTVFGPVQVIGTQALTLTAAGLTAGTSYAATLTGSSDPSETAAAVWPDANASALSAEVTGSITAEPPIAVALTPAVYNPSGPGTFSQTFTWPAGTAPFQSATLFAVGTANGYLNNVTVTGKDTGATYLASAVLGTGSRVEFPVNPVADPNGLVLSGIIVGTNTGTWALSLYGITGTGVVRVVSDTGAPGPTYSVAATVIAASATVNLVPGTTRESTVRIWSAYMSGYLNTGGGVDVQPGGNGQPILLREYGGSTGHPVSINQTYPGGLPVIIANTSLALIASATFSGVITAGVTLSVDIP